MVSCGCFVWHLDVLLPGHLGALHLGTTRRVVLGLQDWNEQSGLCYTLSAGAAEPCCALLRCAHRRLPALSTPLPGPWVKFELKVCVKGTTNCLQNLPLCTATATVTTCPIPGCEPLTNYEVTIVALKSDGSRSPVSNKDGFQTPAAP